MPCLAIGVITVDECLGEGPMSSTPFVAGSRLIDGRPDEGMAHADRVALGLQQPRLFSGVHRGVVDPEGRGSATDDRKAAGVVSRRDQEEGLHWLGQAPATVQEHPLHRVRQVKLGRQRGLPLQLVTAQRHRQLHQGQRVAVGLDEKLLGGRLGERDPCALTHQQTCRCGLQTAEWEHGDVSRVERPCLTLAGGEQEGDGVGLQPTGGEHQRICRRRVEPVRVVDEAQDRARLGCLREQGQGRQPHEERLDRVALLLSERHPQRARLRRGQSVEQSEER